jgi:hypothetical protein
MSRGWRRNLKNRSLHAVRYRFCGKRVRGIALAHRRAVRVTSTMEVAAQATTRVSAAQTDAGDPKPVTTLKRIGAVCTVHAELENSSRLDTCHMRPPALQCMWVATGDPTRPLACRWHTGELIARARRFMSNNPANNEKTRIIMGIYRTFRSLVVDAVQCTENRTFATDLGFINVKRGEWIVCSEGGACFVVDDAFFRRTFVPVDASKRTRATENPYSQDLSSGNEHKGMAAAQRASWFGNRHRSAPRKAQDPNAAKGKNTDNLGSDRETRL